jgi:membrane protein involved in colicin uptake
MIKNKGLKVMSSIIVTLVTFFVGSALAERVARDNTEKGYVFIGGSVKEITVSESVVEENRKLIGWERRRKDISKEEQLRRLRIKQEMIQNDYIKRRQELERRQEQEELERRQKQEEEQEQEKRQEQQRIKKEDWFR